MNDWIKEQINEQWTQGMNFMLQIFVRIKKKIIWTQQQAYYILTNINFVCVLLTNKKLNIFSLQDCPVVYRPEEEILIPAGFNKEVVLQASNLPRPKVKMAAAS